MAGEARAAAAFKKEIKPTFQKNCFGCHDATKLRKAEATQALAEKHLTSVQAALPALEARIAADRAKFASPPDPHLESLVLVAESTERKASLLNAEENLLHAQQQLAAALAASGLGEEETRDKKVGDRT